MIIDVYITLGSFLGTSCYGNDVDESEEVQGGGGYCLIPDVCQDCWDLLIRHTFSKVVVIQEDDSREKNLQKF